MRAALGDGYVEALRRAHDDVPESADLVMCLWNHAATLVRAGKLTRFGLITTNSITQSFNRKVVKAHLDSPEGLSIVFGVPDHPWVDAADGAAVRVAMTAVAKGRTEGTVLSTVAEQVGLDGEARIEFRNRSGLVHADLRLGVDVTAVRGLAANAGLCGQGVKVVGDGFYVADEVASEAISPATNASVVRRLVNARDVLEGRPGRRVIDFFGLTAEEAKRLDPRAFQQVLTRVKPTRDQNKRKSIRELWWRFAWERPVIRAATRDLRRYLVTLSTSKHRFFVFLPADALWDGALFAMALEDSGPMGVLSSRVHAVRAAAAGGRIGVGNDSTWTNKTCFDPFPFPSPTPAQATRIRSLGEALDAHRKRQQALHPGLTITGIYNVLEKLRSGEALTAKEMVIHEQGLVSVLKQVHDDLDAAVFEAYGWPSTLTDEEILERLVALNAERAEEERRVLVRCLRPEFQNPGGAKAVTQEALPSSEDEDEEPAAKSAAPLAWPKALPERIAAVRDLMARAPSLRPLAAVTSAFAKAKPKDVEPVLESLASLGLLVSFDAPDGRHWQAVSAPRA